MQALSRISPRLYIVLIFNLLLVITLPAHAFEQWWQCSSRQGGDWSFGRAPSVCLVNHMQTQSFVKTQYAPLLFLDADPRSSERKRYMTELNALAKEVARNYLKRRKPNVSQAEVNAFTKGLLTLMHQETVWSHYRNSEDGNVRYMRGDVGHGHGLMQVDDRSHQEALLEGRGADLIYNMFYGLDVFYGEWQRASQASCVSSPTDYTNRIRSAWAAYNGGPGRICRWTSTSGPFAHHDKDFLDKLNRQSFKNHVTSETKQTSLNINCLADGSRPCANNGNTPTKAEQGKLYQVGSGYFCLVKDDQLHCLERLNDVNCLSLRDNTNYVSQGLLSDQQVSKFKIKKFDRNYLCRKTVDGLAMISDEIELKKNINLRRTPGGARITTVASGSRAKIIDFQVTSTSDQKRYYKLTHKGNTGYIYAGDQDDYNSWAEVIEDRLQHGLIANSGDGIKITAPFGINLRTKPAGELITRIEKNTSLTVIDRVVRGSQNYLYYLVQYQNFEGYIYSGLLTDMDSIEKWTIKQPTQPLMSLSGKSYQNLKSCPEADCEFTGKILKVNTVSDQVQVIEQKNQWVLVKNSDGSKQGWLPKQNLKTAELNH